MGIWASAIKIMIVILMMMILKMMILHDPVL